ncbi:c-di-GMP-binding flagellar brake protein YcgR [Natronospira proteinivora]|uniref:C-di-GMP-binding flagellar brake protein YcgR n=1 Tax=Natronospira proteinivora TaxID=1807133 RepID=A0ABT1G9N0_9GAMM|nr:PilZ domain-containing protein [Natronospira proteinivora]MCP1728023.1 c-di-GMP-binding flagellar brake protein YcgR [Natronospira proteinivora]
MGEIDHSSKLGASDDRRVFERIDTQHPVKVLDGQGKAHSALALDISLTGLQMLCSSSTARQLLPESAMQGKLAGEELRIQMQLPLKDGRYSDVDARCRVVAARADEGDRFRIGLRYIWFENYTYDDLERFIDDWLH